MQLLKVYKIEIPPDKSISHRAVVLASIAKGVTRIKNILMADDIRRTIEAFRAMGVGIRVTCNVSRVTVVVCGVGMRGLKKPKKSLYLGNSGTTMRILPGILAGQDFEVVLTGDASLSSRPMKRIAKPLRKMGAEIACLAARLAAKPRARPLASAPRNDSNEIYPPLKISGGKLKAIKYKSKIASAQVKSCILLAGLFAKGVTSVNEPTRSRDHTERILRMFGVPCHVSRVRCQVRGPVQPESPGVITIPGDISSAAFFIVAGCILPNTKIIIKNVGLNPTRTGVLDILKSMGAKIKITKTDPSTSSGSSRTRSRDENRKPITEPRGNIIVKSSNLRGITISPREVARAIDEIPIIMLAACFAKGTTTIRGIGELRVKETDRVRSMVTNLRKIGADIRLKAQGSRLKGTKIQPRASSLQPKSECIVIKGRKALHGAQVSSYGDHRTAMSMLVANLAIRGKIKVTGLSCINKSFPNFLKLLHKLN